jgi:hypothetical protein
VGLFIATPVLLFQPRSLLFVTVLFAVVIRRWFQQIPDYFSLFELELKTFTDNSTTIIYYAITKHNLRIWLCNVDSTGFCKHIHSLKEHNAACSRKNVCAL